jgi:hypothetical protein
MASPSSGLRASRRKPRERTWHGAIAKIHLSFIGNWKYISSSWKNSMTPLILFAPHPQQALPGIHVTARWPQPLNNTSTCASDETPGHTYHATVLTLQVSTPSRNLHLGSTLLIVTSTWVADHCLSNNVNLLTTFAGKHTPSDEGTAIYLYTLRGMEPSSRPNVRTRVPCAAQRSDLT